MNATSKSSHADHFESATQSGKSSMLEVISLKPEHSRGATLRPKSITR